MNGLTTWLVKEHVAQLRAQAARRYWRIEVKRARAEIGTGEPVHPAAASVAIADPAPDLEGEFHRVAAREFRSTSV